MNILLHEYELFHILSHESIIDKYTHFTKNFTIHHALGIHLNNTKKVKKILLYLLETYDAMVTTIFHENIYLLTRLIN